MTEAGLTQASEGAGTAQVPGTVPGAKHGAVTLTWRRLGGSGIGNQAGIGKPNRPLSRKRSAAQRRPATAVALDRRPTSGMPVALLARPRDPSGSNPGTPKSMPIGI